VCDNYSVELHGSSTCYLSLSIEQVKEAFVDSLDLSIAAATEMQIMRLTFEGWLECMGRCALGLYGPIELLKLHHLVDCVLRNVLQGNTIEAAVDSVWMEVRGDIRSWNAEPAARGEDIAALAAAETAATAGGGKRAASPASVPKKGGKRGKKGKRSKSLSASSVVGILALGQQSLSAKATLSDGGGKAGTVQAVAAGRIQSAWRVMLERKLEVDREQAARRIQGGWHTLRARIGQRKLAEAMAQRKEEVKAAGKRLPAKAIPPKRQVAIEPKKAVGSNAKRATPAEPKKAAVGGKAAAAATKKK